jgi:hypothetical protein
LKEIKWDETQINIPKEIKSIITSRYEKVYQMLNDE